MDGVRCILDLFPCHYLPLLPRWRPIQNVPTLSYRSTETVSRHGVALSKPQHQKIIHLNFACWPNCWCCIRSASAAAAIFQTESKCVHFFRLVQHQHRNVFECFMFYRHFRLFFALNKKFAFVLWELPLLQRTSAQVHFHQIFFFRLQFSRLFSWAIHFRLHRVVVVGGGHQKHNNREPSIEMYIHLRPFISVFQSSWEWFQFFFLFFFLSACVLASPVHFSLYGNVFVCA